MARGTIRPRKRMRCYPQLLVLPFFYEANGTSARNRKPTGSVETGRPHR